MSFVRGDISMPKGVNRLVDQHLQGTADHTYLLWSLLMLEMWFRAYQSVAGGSFCRLRSVIADLRPPLPIKQ